MSDVIRIDVPENTDAVFSNDGRVFYSLDMLIEEYTPVIENQKRAAEVFKDDVSAGIVAGMESILSAIRQSRDVLNLDALYDE